MASASPVAPSGIGRRDRSSYRVAAQRPAPGRPSALAPHLVRLTDDWALWRTVCLRGAGFPVRMLAALADADLARAADAAIAARAVADPLAREAAEAAYGAEVDTIGFFGPVGWSQIDDGPGIRVTHAPPGRSLATRVTYLEGWAVRAIMAGHVAALRPWLVPRLMPFVGVDGTLLRIPLAPAVQLTPAEAAVLRAVDGTRDAREVAAVVLADPGAGLSTVSEVFALMERLADNHRLAWQIDVAPQDIRPERSARALLSRVTDDAVLQPAASALDDLIAARDELASAAGDAERVAAAMADLEATFTRLRERVTSAFPAQPLPWPMAVHHSPDLMIASAEAAAGGGLTWVLGEIHPSVISMRYVAVDQKREG